MFGPKSYHEKIRAIEEDDEDDKGGNESAIAMVAVS